MIVIRGRLDPGRALNGDGRWRHLLGLGRWNLEYTTKDINGRIIEKGILKADLNGCFVLTLDTPAPCTVEVKVKARTVDAGDSCAVRVSSAHDVVNLPRKLYPCNGHVRSTSRVA